MIGFDLVERILETPSLTNSFILMLTSGEHLGDLARCRELGVSAFLTKPVRRAELKVAIANALGDRTRSSQMAHDLRALANKTAQRPSASVSAHILLAEDNAVNQRVARAILEKAGHSVVVANTGRAALQLWEEQPFDLILMDVQMPDLDGFEATAAIRKKEKHGGTRINIIAMTAHAMAGDRERCLDAGMDNYISKPIHGQELLDMVAKYVKTASHADAPACHPVL